MADVKLQALPAIVTPSLSDIHWVKQGSVDYKETKQQLFDLFNLNYFGFDIHKIATDPMHGLILSEEYKTTSWPSWHVLGQASGGANAKSAVGEDVTSKAFGVWSFTCTAVNARVRDVVIPTPVLNLGKSLFITRLKVGVLSNGTDNCVLASGHHEGYPSGGYGIQLCYDYAVDGNFWTFKTGIIAGSITKTVSALAVDTNWIWFAYTINASGTEVKFYSSSDGVTWTLQATHTTNIPTSGAYYYSPVLLDKRLGSTTPMVVYSDGFTMIYDFNRP